MQYLFNLEKNEVIIILMLAVHGDIFITHTHIHTNIYTLMKLIKSDSV